MTCNRIDSSTFARPLLVLLSLLCLVVPTYKSYASSSDKLDVHVDGAVQSTGNKKIEQVPTKTPGTNAQVRNKIVDKNSTKPLTNTSGSTALTTVKVPGSGAQTSSSMALYDEKAVKSYNKAVDLHSQGLFDRAIVEYEDAIQNDPKMSEAYTNLGTIYVAKREYKEAIKVLIKSYELNPNSVVMMNAYASALFNDGARERAVELWKRAIKADPSFSGTYENLGEALEDMGRLEEAKEIRNLDPAVKRSKTLRPVKKDTAGDFENAGEMPLQYKPRN